MSKIRSKWRKGHRWNVSSLNLIGGIRVTRGIRLQDILSCRWNDGGGFQWICFASMNRTSRARHFDIPSIRQWRCSTGNSRVGWSKAWEDGIRLTRWTGQDGLDIWIFHRFSNYVVQRILRTCVDCVIVVRSTVMSNVDYFEKSKSWLSESERRWNSFDECASSMFNNSVVISTRMRCARCEVCSFISS